MTSPTPPEDKLQVVVHKHIALVRVSGRGSFKVSSSLKEFTSSALEKGCTSLVFDMADCIGMDSTFMGVLAGLSIKFKQRGGGEVVLLNMAQRTRSLLATLGLDQAVKAYLAGDTPQEYAAVASLAGVLSDLTQAPESKQATATTMLEAHENLVQLSPENLPRFKDVLAYLREDVRKPEGS